MKTREEKRRDDRLQIPELDGASHENQIVLLKSKVLDLATELRVTKDRLGKEVKMLRLKTHKLHKEIAISKGEGMKEATALMERLMKN